uniref:Uncharacterized protein n=1 Tax=Strigamia maritima TaxID=126957 RepID=T1J494_STRMM
MGGYSIGSVFYFKYKNIISNFKFRPSDHRIFMRRPLASIMLIFLRELPPSQRQTETLAVSSFLPSFWACAAIRKLHRCTGPNGFSDVGKSHCSNDY